MTWEEAVEGATVEATLTASEVLLLSLLMVHCHSFEAVRKWTEEVVKHRRAYTGTVAATFVVPWCQSGSGTITQILKEAAKRKCDEVMDMVGDAMARFDGPGRVARPVARTALNAHILTMYSGSKKRASARSNARLNRAAVPVALLLAETEKSDASSLTTLLISGASREAGPPRTYAVQLEEMEAELKQSQQRHVRVVAEMRGRHQREIDSAVATATAGLVAELEQREQQRERDEADNERAQNELTQRISELDDEMASVEECAAATQERARRVVELADMRASQATLRAARDRENRKKVTADVRDRIRRNEEEAVCTLLADYDEKLAAARTTARDATARAEANERAVSNLASCRRVLSTRDERIRELEHELELEREAGVEGARALEKVAQIPDLGVSKERGRPVPTATRKVCLHMLANLTPPSGVVPNIVALLTYYVPFLLNGIHLPTKSCVRTIRKEMLFISQALAANKIGFAKRAKQLCHDGGDIDGVAGVTIGEHITNADGTDETVVLDALALTVGKTAQLECDTIEDTIDKLNSNLEKWRWELGDSNDSEGIIAASGSVGFHQLKHGGTMSDACNQALLLDALIEKRIVVAVKAQFTPEQLAAMSPEQLADETELYSSTCHHHIRNIGVAHGEKAVDAFMTDKLEESMAKIPRHKRITGKVCDHPFPPPRTRTHAPHARTRARRGAAPPPGPLRSAQ